MKILYKFSLMTASRSVTGPTSTKMVESSPTPAQPSGLPHNTAKTSTRPLSAQLASGKVRDPTLLNSHALSVVLSRYLKLKKSLKLRETLMYAKLDSFFLDHQSSLRTLEYSDLPWKQKRSFR